MKQIAAGRVGQIASKYGEHAPMTGVCCNACRTCVTTNAVGILTAALAGLGLGARRALRRRAGRPS